MMSSQVLERAGMMGLLATAVLWMEVERRRVLGELREERKAKEELLGDFRSYSGQMAEVLASAVGE